MKLKDKFEFGEDFQENILQYAVTDNNGYRILTLIKDYYFTLVEHQVVAAAIARLDQGGGMPAAAEFGRVVDRGCAARPL